MLALVIVTLGVVEYNVMTWSCFSCLYFISMHL
jgi:hypothetical protein